MAVFPFIFIKDLKPGSRLLNHECIHLRQQLEMGFFLFYLWYGLEYLVRLFIYQNHYLAYRNISFEREAYCHESSLAYLRHRRFWAFWNFL